MKASGLVGLEWKLLTHAGTDRLNDSVGKRGNLLSARLRRFAAVVIRDPVHLPKAGFLLRVGASADSSSLDLDAMDVVRQKHPSLEEEFMVVSTAVTASCQTGETIEIQLTLEGGDLGELEVVGKQCNEFLRLVHHKASSVRLPRYDVFMTVNLCILKHFVKLERERCGDSSTGGVLLLVPGARVM